MSEPEPDVLAEEPAVEESIVFAIDEPAAAEDPAATEEPAAAEEPAATEEPAAAEEPAAEEGEPVADEPVHNQILPYVNSTVVSIWSSIYPTFTRRRRGSTPLFKW